LEAEHLDRTNPAKVGRREGFAAQVEMSITQLESDIASATAANDSARVAALTADLDAKKAWLSALG
jgi:hypothetical protein